MKRKIIILKTVNRHIKEESRKSPEFRKAYAEETARLQNPCPACRGLKSKAFPPPPTLKKRLIPLSSFKKEDKAKRAHSHSCGIAML